MYVNRGCFHTTQFFSRQNYLSHAGFCSQRLLNSINTSIIIIIIIVMYVMYFGDYICFISGPARYISVPCFHDQHLYL